MPQILVRGLGRKTVQRLKQRARMGGRSLQPEVRSILEQAATTLTPEEARSPHGCRLVTADRRVYDACREGDLSRLVMWVADVG